MNKDYSPEKRKKIQAMRELCSERKTQNFQNLKKWDQNRASKLIVHRKIIDQIDQALQIKLSQSNQYIKIIKQFFIDLLTQKNRYLTHSIQNPQSKLQLNTIGRIIYPNASKSLVKLYDSTQNCKYFNHVKHVLEVSLQKIDQFLIETQKQLMQIRTQIELLVLQVQDCNMETLQKCDALVTIYNSGKSLKTFQSQQDFFIQQQNFLYEAKKQLESQKTLGCQIVNYLQFVQKRQAQKLLLLKKLLGEYINSITSHHQLSSQHLHNLIEILNKNTQSQYLDQYFSIQQLLPRQLIIQLAFVQRKHQSQIKMKYLKAFLKKFEYEEFDNRNLILKIFKVFLRNKQSINERQKQTQNHKNAFIGEQKQTIQSVQIFITIDGFINIYHNQLSTQTQDETADYHEIKSPIFSMKNSPSLILSRVSDIELEINVKKWGLISFSESEQYSINLVFNSQDQREEFLQFVGQLK